MVFSIIFATTTYVPPRVVTLRTDVDGWEDADVNGAYGNDGAWHFELADARYRPGHRFKLVLDRVLYMDGPDQVLTDAPEYRFDDSSARFTYNVRYVTERYGVQGGNRVSLRTSADQYKSDQPGIYADGAWNFSVSEPVVHDTKDSFRIQFVLDGVGASAPRALRRTRQDTYFTDADINFVRKVKRPEAATAARMQSASQSMSKHDEKTTPLPAGQMPMSPAGLASLLADENERQNAETALQDTQGNWPQALERLEANLPEVSVQRISLAHAVAEVTDGHLPLVRAIVDDPGVNNLRDVALNFDVARLAALADARELPAGAGGVTLDDRRRSYAAGVRRKLFNVEPTAVLQRMVQDAEIPIQNASVQTGVAGFLDNQPAFNIRTMSVYQAFRQPQAFENISPDVRSAVAEQLKTLQRVQAISPVPEAVPHLIEANLTSAFSVAQMPESTFMAASAPDLGDETARQVYTNAINAEIRNQSALMRMHEILRGPGLAVMDGQAPLDTRVAQLQAVAERSGVPLNLSDLFGGIDYCECEDCRSVYSPAAYFVELLEYLRNNNLQPGHANTGQAGIDGTPLQMLLRRRPDLGCLELTCENTFTVLPYIDLVNEVMESFIVHLGSYHGDVNDPKQTTLDVFNVGDETTSELLAQPQHVNYQAYCTLKNAVYPFTLPYHQPIDAIRVWLPAFSTSRHELMDTFRTATETCDAVTLTPGQLDELRQFHGVATERAVDAEYLGLTQEDYIILTREAYWPKPYFDLTMQTSLTTADYEQKIGVRPVHEYYGYISESDMLSADETTQIGLTFVKKQFLRRTGIHYPDLVELLKTRYVNPAYPAGEALTLMNAIQFSYRFLQTLVDASSSDPAVRFAKLVKFLNSSQTIVPLLDRLLHPSLCGQPTPGKRMPADFTNWVYCYFERIGQLIVLDSGQGPRLSVEGALYTDNELGPELVGHLHSDGTIVGTDGVRIGTVTIDGLAVDTDGKPFTSRFGGFLWIKTESGQDNGWISEDGSISASDEQKVTWLPVRDTCDLRRVRLIHLDGSALTAADYDRIHRFIRLWRKTTWTIEETDLALTGLSAKPSTDGSVPAADCEFVRFETFHDDCARVPVTRDGQLSCPDILPAMADISTELVHQLVAVRKALDLSALPLEKLLTFWADIGTAGDAPLYSRLFLTHNVVGIDKVFEPDPNGNVLTSAATLSGHMPALMAALKLTADDIAAIASYRHLPDALTLDSVSMLYRHSLLAKLLHVKISDLPAVFTVFGDPFTNAESTRRLLQDWQDMEDAGFTFRQLDYIVHDHDDPRRPLAPSQRTILQTAKTLYDGLTGIDNAHPDLPADAADSTTDDLVRTTAALLFEQPIVEQIIGLLDGTAVYTTNAPPGLSITIPDRLATILKYSNQAGSTPPAATLQVTGILADADVAQAKALSDAFGWGKAIDRAGKQPRRFFTETLAGLFTDPAEAQQALLSADVNPAPDPRHPESSASSTAPVKRLYFLRHLLPYLRKRLARKFIVDTMSTASGLPSEVTDTLLANLLHTGTPPEPALTALENIKGMGLAGQADWKGYLIPAATDSYVFVAVNSDAQPPPILLGGSPVAFTHEQEDPSNVWWSDPVSLKAGTLQWLDTNGLNIAQLQWKTATSATAVIPAAALLPDMSAQGTAEVFAKLSKAALLLSGFTITAAEASYIQTHQADFDGFDFNALTIQHWRRLRAYSALRNTLPKTDATLLDLFGWASQPGETGDGTALRDRIAEVTLWDKTSLTSLLSTAHFDLESRTAFRSEANLIKLQKAVSVASRTGTSIDRLFAWAKPTSAFWPCHDTATEIQAALRARYDQTDWEQVVRPLYDQLRENQKAALISYLLVQPDLINWGVVDADSLFEFFLIDVQMSACIDTSRIKQAISTVQSFIQRCLLGLEAHHGVANDVLDRQRWDWMQKYRVWEANRKIFLYPENWLQSGLRDDKSPFFVQLESELLQKDIDPRTVADALRTYVTKVDEVANLQVDGIFLETLTAPDGSATPQTLHVFARTRNAPHVFYYRYYTCTDQNWYPWQKIDVDIPSYDVETTAANGQTTITGNGAYLIPVVWHNRLLIFFPQFLRKTASRPIAAGKTFKNLGETGSVSDQNPLHYWEIKLAWSERRNGKWTQKQLSPGPVYDTDPSQGGTPPLNTYAFVPRTMPAPNERIVIDVYRNVARGAFQFSGSQLLVTTAIKSSPDILTTNFNYLLNRMHTLQGTGMAAPDFALKEPYFDVTDTEVTFKASPALGVVTFYHRFAHELLGTLNTDTLDGLFDYYLRNITSNADKDDTYGRITTPDGTTSYHELKMPYALYNWEAAFHTPMLLADRLAAAGQFDEALAMLHRVLNPFASGTDNDPVWRFTPFREANPQNDLEQLFLDLKPNTPDTRVDEWRLHPFQPHVVTRGRPAAYMKWVAMKYIQTWIDYGDYYFRQNTLETLPLAIQCYVVAAHAYGPRGETIPKRGHELPQTYNSLLDKWDAFGNAIVELELAFPFSNQTPLPIGSSNGVVGLANIFGFATTLYFGIPDNPQLRALRDLIDDRLFKIRHCQDIQGVIRQLPLFEPPIEPGLLVQAAAQGLSLSSVLTDLNSPMPNYRFAYQLQKALELCAELKSLGAGFLSAKEKGDAEALAQLRATHETSINNLVMTVRTQQLDEATKALEALQESRKGPVYRLQHQLKLIGEDLAKVPQADADFTELPDQIEQPIDDSGLKLIPFEKEEMDKAATARDVQLAVGIAEALAGVFHAIPTFNVRGTPFGVGGGADYGGPNLGNITQAVARGIQVGSNELSYQSSNAGRKAGFLRQLQERVQQANVAGYEIKNIDRQALTQQIRIAIAQQEITNQQKQIDNAQEVQDYLRSKYSSTELYAWMDNEIRGLYYQAYTMAYDLAKKAEKLFRYERGLTDSDFIQFGYWDSGHDGLLAGERLYHGLKQLEAAYQEKRGHDYEITKSISLRQLNPMALVALRETGACEFIVPEVLFDMDYPGHYLRRLKTASLMLPAVVGPYTSLNCTLRLLEHKYRIRPIAQTANDYPENTEGTDDRFTTVNVPITSIAVSSQDTEAGVFELNFRDERYVPFEGAGAISKWRIELPSQFRQFDYDTITDVVLRLRYTAMDGGDKLKTAAAQTVQDYIGSVENLSRNEGLFAAFDLKHDFPDEWYRANRLAADATERVLTIDHLNDKLPIFTKGRSPAKIQATDIYLYASAPALTAAKLTATQGGNQITFTDGPATGTMKTFAAKDVDSAMDNLQLTIADTTTQIDKLWLLERYTLQ
jgi:Tc toxin complex TcA C-terminal TcB-binding domain/Neuraminidase-like domain/Salmonella virulence plasmid 28.1kDa A protein